jgi:hypothetical protein
MSSKAITLWLRIGLKWPDDIFILHYTFQEITKRKERQALNSEV